MLNLALTLRKRLLLLACIVLVCFFMVSLLSGLIMYKFGAVTPALRIVTMIQDILLFIVPPVVTAVIVTRQPATLLCIDRRMSWISTALAIAVLIVSIPVMNEVIYLNQNLPLPAGLAATLTELEESAATTVDILFGAHDIPNLIVSILIVGVFAGLSEELLFRGGLQRLLSTGGMNHHAAIWITAAVFSLVHMQFYGFFPRMLLGALFGYALWWSGTLWLPVVLHALNNTLYVITQYANYGKESTSVIETVGHGSDFFAVVLSLVLTVCCLWLFHHFSSVTKNLQIDKNKPQSDNLTN